MGEGGGTKAGAELEAEAGHRYAIFLKPHQAVPINENIEMDTQLLAKSLKYLFVNVQILIFGLEVFYFASFLCSFRIFSKT